MNEEEPPSQALNLDNVSSTKLDEGIGMKSLPPSRRTERTDQDVFAPPPDGGLHAWLQVLMVSSNQFQV